VDATDIIKNGGKGATTGEKIALVLGISLFALTVFAEILSIKKNLAEINKLKKEGHA
jgi:hypothetical protein